MEALRPKLIPQPPAVADNSDHPPILADLIGLCFPSLGKRREVEELPSLFEKRGAGGEFF
jgi:hypothetical protein